MVEKRDDRRGCAEAFEHGIVQVRLVGDLGRKMSPQAPLPASGEVVSGVVFAEALWRPGKREAFRRFPLRGEEFAEFGGTGELAEVLVMFREMSAEGEELFALRHVDSCSDHEFGAGEVEVEACARGLVQAFASPPCSNVVLVRAFIGAEPGVSVDAHHDLGRRSDVLGGEVKHLLVEAGDGIGHRLPLDAIFGELNYMFYYGATGALKDP